MLLTLTIGDVIPATPRARIVRLDLHGQSFPYEPGQAVLVADHGGPKRRPYSLASAPQEAARQGWIELLVGIDETGHPGPHLTLVAGGRVDVEGPVGSFTFPEEPIERRFVFVAGGVGIAPLRAMLGAALRTNHEAIGVLYSARTAEEFAYGDELRAMAADGQIELRMTVTREAGGDWTGHRGRIAASDIAPLVHGDQTLCFICGPRAMVDDMPAALEALGVSRDRIRIEEWG